MGEELDYLVLFVRLIMVIASVMVDMMVPAHMPMKLRASVRVVAVL
jgi:hypothetical protein